MRKIKHIVMDVDGSLTDGRLYIGSEGELFKAFNVKDGCGIHDIMIPKGIEPIIITGRQSKIVEYRCRELGITGIYQGVQDKAAKLRELINEAELESTGYFGDDINDLECMKSVQAAGGIAGCPADAVDEVKNIADFISSKKGGNGALREFVEWLIYDKPVQNDEEAALKLRDYEKPNIGKSKDEVMTGYYKNLFSHNTEINDHKVKKISAGIKSSIVGISIMITATAALMVLTRHCR